MRLGASKPVPLRHLLGASLVLQCMGLGLLMIAQLLIARILGVSGFGIYSYATACATAMITVAKFGTDTLVYQMGGQFAAAQDWRGFADLMRGAGRLIARASAMSALGLAAYAAYLHLGRGRAELALAVLIAALAVPIVALSTLRQVALVAMDRVFQGLAPDHLGRTIALIFGALLLGALGFSFAPPMVAVNVASYVVALVVGQYWLSRSPLARGGTIVESAKSASCFSSARGFFLFAIAYQLVSQYDMLLAGLIFESAPTGLYAVARQIASVGILGLLALQSVASPRIASAHVRDDRIALSRIVDVVGIGGVLFTALYSAVILIGGTHILGLLGKDFSGAYTCLLWLMVAQGINALSGPAGTVAAMMGLQAAAARIYVGSAALGCIALIALVPAYGISGAAFGVVVSTTSWCMCMNLLLYRKAGMSVWLGRSRRVVASG